LRDYQQKVGAAIPRLTGSRCVCRTCGQYFNSVSMFDAHRIGLHPSRRCLSPFELAQRGYTLNPKGFWIRVQKPAQLAQDARSVAGGIHVAGTP